MISFHTLSSSLILGKKKRRKSFLHNRVYFRHRWLLFGWQHDLGDELMAFVLDRHLAIISSYDLLDGSHAIAMFGVVFFGGRGKVAMDLDRFLHVVRQGDEGVVSDLIDLQIDAPLVLIELLDGLDGIVEEVGEKGIDVVRLHEGKGIAI